MTSSDAELKAVLHALLAEIDDLRVNDELFLHSKQNPTRSDLLDVRKAAETTNHKRFAKLRKQIDELAL